uniref:Uncharacterized protein n=1 Tax=Amphimedon queenslandica TaxID=400682 RepID=A0A1X7SS61_AMPQE
MSFVLTDSLDLELNWDEFETTLTKKETKLNEALVGIAVLENSKSSAYTHDLSLFDENEEDLPSLPPLLLPAETLQPLNPLNAFQCPYRYMPAAPLYSQQQLESPYYYHHSLEQPALLQSPPLQPVQLSNFYNTSPTTTSSVFAPSGAIPKCFPILGNKNGATTIHASLNIDEENLTPYNTVLKKYPSLHHERGIGTLAVKLASESFFGLDILKQCTVMGYCPFLHCHLRN